MSLGRSLREVSVSVLSLVFAAAGGILGLVLMLVMEGWIPIPVGVLVGLYAALILAYHKAIGERDAALRQIEAQRANPTIVEALLPRYQFAIHELINRLRQCTTAEHLEKWKIDMRRWESETRELLEHLNCTPAEVSSFWDYTEADLDRYGKRHASPKINRRFQAAQFRIDALRRIIDGYSGRDVFGR